MNIPTWEQERVIVLTEQRDAARRAADYWQAEAERLAQRIAELEKKN